MIEMVGAPLDLGGMRSGSRLGPAALRLAGISETLEELGLEVWDSGDVASSCQASTTEGGLRNFGPTFGCICALRALATESLAAGRLPLILGGEHTLSVAGVSAALAVPAGPLALLWIDAHADVNTPGSSQTGNVHGMPIAALQGAPSGVSGPADDEWRKLLEQLGPPYLAPERTAWYGLRDVDAAEREAVRRGFAVTMHDVDRRGVDATVGTLDQWLRASGAERLWISFDVDALDPILAPGTGTAVRGGLSYREAHLLAELLSEAIGAPDVPYRLVGLDVVETNPLVDSNNETAKMAVEWIASLFGKTILGKR